MSLIIASYFDISVKTDAVFQLLGATGVSATKDSSWTCVGSASVRDRLLVGTKRLLAGLFRFLRLL